MTCRRDYTADPSLRERVFTLLDVVFPGIAGAEAALRPWGLDWTAVSTPYVVEDGERVLAHVGLIPFTAELDGVHGSRACRLSVRRSSRIVGRVAAAPRQHEHSAAHVGGGGYSSARTARPS